MDRAYIDFQRLFVFTLSSAFFVVRTKSNLLLERRYSHPVDKSMGVLSDQTVSLSSVESATAYPGPLRKVRYFDAERNKRLKFLTNNFTLPARTIAEQEFLLPSVPIGQIRESGGPQTLLRQGMRFAQDKSRTVISWKCVTVV